MIDSGATETTRSVMGPSAHPVLGLVLAVLAAIALSACEPSVGSTEFVVNTTVDGSDANPGDGVCEKTVGSGDCTLRAAIDEANAATTTVAIATSLDNPTLTLTSTGVADDTNASGDLDVTASVALYGLGVIDASATGERAFDVHPEANLGVVATVISGADTGNDGAAIRSASYADLLWSTVTANTTTGGAALSVTSTGSMSLFTSTVTANTTSGPAVRNQGLLSATYSTIADNSNRGITTTPGAHTDLVATIVAGHPGGDCFSDAPTSAGYNLDSDGSCSLTAIGDQPSVDPMLGPLTDGRYLPLLPGSPAIDSIPTGTPGFCDVPLDDQAGGTRPRGPGCDAGSVESTHATMSGTVRDDAAIPIEGVHVCAFDSGAVEAGCADTDVSGTYQIGLVEGTYNVSFDATGTGRPVSLEWYGDTPDPAAAEPVAVSAGVDTAGVDATLSTPAAHRVSAGDAHTCAIGADATIGCWGSNEWAGSPVGQATPPAGAFVDVGAGDYHTCALATDATIACWGDDNFGQTDAPTGTFSAVSAGDFHDCALATNNTVSCWGADSDGQATPPAGTFIGVEAGGFHTCAIAADATIDCWGSDAFGQSVPPAGTYTSIASGYLHTCGLSTTGTVDCWGADDAGQSSPPPGEFVAVTAGGFHTCAIAIDATAACWGSDADGQSTPPPGTFTDIGSGTAHTCGITTDGPPACWGSDADGQSGSAPSFTSDVPATGVVGSPYSHVFAAGGDPAATYSVTAGALPPGLALDGATGELAGTPTTTGAWVFIITATNLFGSAGQPVSFDVVEPAGAISGRVVGPDLAPITGVHVCAFDPGDTLVGCDDTDASGDYLVVGLVADDYTVSFDPTDAATPVALEWYDDEHDRVDAVPVTVVENTVTAGIDATLDAAVPITLDAGARHTCRVTDLDSVGCWGDDTSGQATAPAGTYTDVSAGDSHTCAVRTDATIACWGDDAHGQATAPPGTFVGVSAGENHTCAVRTDATIACWGDDAYGQATAPAGTFTAASAGAHHTCAVRTDATVDCWGDDAHGQATAPTGTFTAVSAGENHTCAVRTDATIACWGSDAYGQGTAPAGTYTTVSAGARHTCAVRTDDTIACWGSDSHGQATAPAGTYTAVSAGARHTCAIGTLGTVECRGDDAYGQSTPI